MNRTQQRAQHKRRAALRRSLLSPVSTKPVSPKEPVANYLMRAGDGWLVLKGVSKRPSDSQKAALLAEYQRSNKHVRLQQDRPSKHVSKSRQSLSTDATGAALGEWHVSSPGLQGRKGAGAESQQTV